MPFTCILTITSTGFRGISAQQDSHFRNKEKDLLKKLAKTFPPEYFQKPDLSRVNWDVIKPWIATRVTELLSGVEDDVLIVYIIEQLVGQKNVDPRLFQINLTGFLENNTPIFVGELWNLLLSAAENESGIPQVFLDQQAEELRRKREADVLMAERLRLERERRRGSHYYDDRRRRSISREKGPSSTGRRDHRSSKQYRDDHHPGRRERNERRSRSRSPAPSRSMTRSRSPRDRERHEYGRRYTSIPKRKSPSYEPYRE